MSSHTAALIGKAGEQLVAAELLRRGVDVAIPAYDRGIDLLAYREHDLRAIVPIQVKARSATGFHFQRTWFSVDGLFLIHVWKLETVPEFYIFGGLGHVEEALGPTLSASASWVKDGRYNVTTPGSDAVERMQHHRGRWDRVLSKLPPLR